MSFLNDLNMWPFQYTQLPKSKPQKMNKKDDKEFEDDEYIPLYTFALPVEVRDIISETFLKFTKTSREDLDFEFRVM